MTTEATVTRAVDSFATVAAERGFAMDGLVVEVDGAGVVERSWSPDERRDVYSVSKTFTSVAVGLAAAEGLLHLDDAVLDLLPEFEAIAAAGVDGITVRHLLSMTSGIVHRWNDPDFDHDGDPAAAILSTPLGAAPGDRFAYRGSSSYLLSRIVHAATGQDMRDYLVPRLFTPLGIRNPQWLRCPLGYSMGALGLQLRAREVARLGSALLHGGVYLGQQVVPEEYVTAMTAEKVPIGDHRPTNSENGVRADGYGLGLWSCGRGGAWRMDGIYGQFCILVPERGACVTTTARLTGDTTELLDCLWETLISEL